MTPGQREDLRKLQAETLCEKNLRLIREKQAVCPHNTIEEQDGFRWCGDCDFDFN